MRESSKKSYSSPDLKYTFSLSKPVDSEKKISPKKLNFDSGIQEMKETDKEKNLREWLESKVKNIKEKSGSMKHPKEAKGTEDDFDRYISGYKSQKSPKELDRIEEELDQEQLNHEKFLEEERFLKETEEKIIIENQKLLEKEQQKKEKEELREKLISKAQYLRSQITYFDMKNKELQSLEHQYTMNGDPNIIPKAQYISLSLKNLEPHILQFMNELSYINTQLTKLN